MEFSLIQRPPIVKNLAVAVSLLRKVWVSSNFFTTHPLEPLLALAVLGIFDVLACVQKRPALKAPIHIASMGTIARVLDDRQQAVRLLQALSAAVLPPGSTLLVRLFIRTLQDCQDLLV